MAELVTALAVAGWLIVLSVNDIRRRRLPNVLTLPGAGLILLGAFWCGHGGPALAGAAALAGCYLLLHLLAPTAMGAGDVKLALGLGALTGALGTDAWVLAALAAPLLTAVWGLAARIRVVPHGPSMCVASAAAAALCL